MTKHFYVVYGLKILNVQLIDIRSNDSSKLKSQCKQIRHRLIRILIHSNNSLKYSQNELIEKYFQGKFYFVQDNVHDDMVNYYSRISVR